MQVNIGNYFLNLLNKSQKSICNICKSISDSHGNVITNIDIGVQYTVCKV